MSTQMSVMDLLEQIQDVSGFEEDTDLFDFRAVCQSPMSPTSPASPVPADEAETCAIRLAPDSPIKNIPTLCCVPTSINCVDKRACRSIRGTVASLAAVSPDKNERITLLLWMVDFGTPCTTIIDIIQQHAKNNAVSGPVLDWLDMHAQTCLSPAPNTPESPERLLFPSAACERFTGNPTPAVARRRVIIKPVSTRRISRRSRVIRKTRPATSRDEQFPPAPVRTFLQHQGYTSSLIGPGKWRFTASGLVKIE